MKTTAKRGVEAALSMNEWFNHIDLTEKEKLLVVASFVKNQPNGATQEEIDAFLKFYTEKMIIAEFLTGVRQLLIEGSVEVTREGDELAVKPADESWKAAFEKISAHLQNETPEVSPC